MLYHNAKNILVSTESKIFPGGNPAKTKNNSKILPYLMEGRSASLKVGIGRRWGDARYTKSTYALLCLIIMWSLLFYCVKASCVLCDETLAPLPSPLLPGVLLEILSGSVPLGSPNPDPI